MVEESRGEGAYGASLKTGREERGGCSGFGEHGACGLRALIWLDNAAMFDDGGLRWARNFGARIRWSQAEIATGVRSDKEPWRKYNFISGTYTYGYDTKSVTWY
jgi:hypothetical protein